MKRNWTSGPLFVAAVLVALLTTACAPMVPDLSSAEAADAADAFPPNRSATTSPVAATDTSRTPTTTVATTLPPTTAAATSTSTTTTTSESPSPTSVTVGAWTAAPDVRDESGQQFSASVTVPVLGADVDQALRARVVTLVEGHIQSQVGGTLALWRSIEGQGERDLSGSTLTLDYEIAAFEPQLISFRFFSTEQLAGSGGVKRQVTTLMVDLESGIAIGLDDVIASGESRDTLLVLVADGLLNDYFDGDDDSFGLWAGNLSVGDLDRALLTADGLEIWFDELEVGPPDIGVPVVAIPYVELGDILDPAGVGNLFNSAAN